MRILSGIQPSGALHLGNYFGMMRPAIELQEQGEAFYFIANYHSMTSLLRRGGSAGRTRSTWRSIFWRAAWTRSRSVFFRQSDVPEVTELAWMLSTVTPMGLLERCHSYKDKIAEGISPQPRPVRLPGADGRRHPDLRFEHRAGRPRPEAARRSDARHRHQVQRDLRRNVRHARAAAFATKSPSCPASTARR